MRNFRSNKSGLAYIWGCLVIGLILCPIVYFPLSFVWQHMYVDIVGTYTFTGDSAYALSAIQLIISYMLTLAVVFFINWCVVNAKAQQYEYG